ncbi:MAG: ABC transporter permease [Candidatus Nomurabacteria bacterium]|nr:MAG: ABC transporter permease [Candidatus Nomurabacteria bacterium]
MSEVKALSNNLFSKRNKSLLRELVKTEFKLRYQNSFLGYAWSLLKPLGLFTVLYVVFTKIFSFGAGIPHYPVYLLLGIVLWTFFIESTGGALSSIVGRGDLIRKISFPKYIIVISGTVSSLINLFLSLVIVLIFALFNGVSFGSQALFAPLLIGEVYALVLGIGLILSTLYVNFRDLSHIWEVLMQAAFYAIPIIYDIHLVFTEFNATAAKIIMLNPVSQIIQDLRYSLVTKSTARTTDIVQMPFALIPYLLVPLILLVGSVYFRKRSKFFAEQI